jgi:hypothetical protein
MSVKCPRANSLARGQKHWLRPLRGPLGLQSSLRCFAAPSVLRDE